MVASILNVIRFVYLVLLSQCAFSERPTSRFLGISPQDEEYYSAEEISCRDESKIFSRERLNDGFCDCPDGTDEPGTSACPEGRFYCRNAGSAPKLIFSSRVNDLICDCCDGSDENDGSIICPNTCVKDGTVEIRESEEKLEGTHLLDLTTLHLKHEENKEDLIHKFKGIKLVILLQVIFVGCIIFLRCFYRQMRCKRRRHL